MIAGELQNTGHVYMRTWEMELCLHIRWEGEESMEASPAGIKKKKESDAQEKKKNWDMNKWQEDGEEGSRCSGEVHETWFEGKCRK